MCCFSLGDRVLERDEVSDYEGDEVPDGAIQTILKNSLIFGWRAYEDILTEGANLCRRREEPTGTGLGVVVL